VFSVRDGLTLQLAGLAGSYLLLSALGLLLPREAAARFVSALRDNAAVAHAVGAVAFFIGAGGLLLHTRFSRPIEALVTLTAGWWALEGAAVLAAPSLVLARPDTAAHLRRMNLLALPVALILIAAAVFGHVES